MRRWRPAAAAILAAALITTLTTTVGAAGADQPSTSPTAASAGGTATAAAAPIRMRLRQAVLALPLAQERRTGYDRDLFPHWHDTDRDRCDTREEVLIAESRVRARVGAGCRVIAGRWTSYYDGATWTRPADVDIDHVVALAEAWDSGAWRWRPSQRHAFANDLGDHRPLLAITDNVNAAKGDRDPAEWLPRPGTRCRYLGEWVAIKLRWRLRVDPRERHVLAGLSRQCPDVVVTVNRAI